MRKLLIVLVILGLAAALIYIYLLKNGYTDKAIRNSPKTYDLSVNCGYVEDMIVKKVVTVTVSNSSDRVHHNVDVKIIAYDSNGDVLINKNTEFTRTLGARESLAKPIMVPVRTVRCDCVVEDSNPE